MLRFKDLHYRPSRRLRADLAMIFLAMTAFAKTASAGTTTAQFDLEGYAGGFPFSALALTDDGLTITISQGGHPFTFSDISDLNGSAVYGKSSLQSFGPSDNFPFYVDFSSPINSFTVQMGNLGLGIVDTLDVMAFAGPHATGTRLGSNSTTMSLPSDASSIFIKTLAISGSGIRSVQFMGGSSADPNSLYYDNLSATLAAVPLPPAISIAPAGLLIAWLAGRRMSISR